jgi:hypothetical protein
MIAVASPLSDPAGTMAPLIVSEVHGSQCSRYVPSTKLESTSACRCLGALVGRRWKALRGLERVATAITSR